MMYTIYLWYVSKLKKYYLGSTLGKDPYYTHSSKDEEFCSLVPNSARPQVERKEFLDKLERGEIEGISRKIIYRGDCAILCDTIEKKEQVIRDIEEEYLKNRKKKCWGRYFNITSHAIGSEIKLDYIPHEGRKLQPNGQYSYQGYHKHRRQAELSYNRRLERVRRRRLEMRKKYGTDNDEVIHGVGTLENF